MVVQYVLGPLPKYDFFSHYLLAVVAQILQWSLIAATRLPGNGLRLRISLAIVFELNPDVKAIWRETIEVLVRVLWADLPPINLYQIILTNEGCVERNPEYLRITCNFTRVFEYNHDVAEENHRLSYDWQIYFYIFVSVVSPYLIQLFSCLSIIIEGYILKSIHPVYLKVGLDPLSRYCFNLYILYDFYLW